MTSDRASFARETMSHRPMTAHHSRNGICYWMENFGRDRERGREGVREEGGREGGSEGGSEGGREGGRERGRE